MVQVAARNQGALSAQLEVLMGQLRLNPATLNALQSIDFSAMGYASPASATCCSSSAVRISSLPDAVSTCMLVFARTSVQPGCEDKASLLA